MTNLIISVLLTLLILPAYSQTTESGVVKSEKSESRAWYVMRQVNTAPLLLGLTQKMGKAIESSQRNDSIWTGIEQGETLNLNIAVEGDISGEIFIGFFKDPDWSAEPVQVRGFPGPGEYMIENLPIGKYQIGAMIGSLPTAAALGVQQMWPEPVVIKHDITSHAKVLVSRDFQLHATGSYNNTVSKDLIGDWKDMETDNLLQGRVTGPGGQSIAFATVQIREHNPGAKSIRAPDRGTNEQGYYKCDGVNWPYTVGVIRYKLMPSVFGYCHQYLMYNHVFEDCETVNFQYEDFPAGNAAIKGRVLDNNGNSLKEFFVDVRTKMDWDVRKNPDDKYYTITGYRIPFTSEDGSFELNNLPQGDFTASVIPFDIRAYEIHRGEDVILEAGKTTNIDLKVVSKNILYGRVLFLDGSPAIIKPAPWSGARTSILMPMGSMARGVADLDDDGYFAAHLSEREVELLESGKSRLVVNVPTSEERRRKTMGDFPYEKLAKDKTSAGVLTIERPDQKPQSLIGKSLPEVSDLGINISSIDVNDKSILICFFDMEQRPSRNCILQLSKRTQELKEKDIVIIAVQASKIQQVKLDEWIKENNISFEVGMIEGDSEKIQFTWGVKGLPWLILTDKEHIVIAEGFSLDELDEKITKLLTTSNLTTTNNPDWHEEVISTLEYIARGYEANAAGIDRLRIRGRIFHTQYAREGRTIPESQNFPPEWYNFEHIWKGGKRRYQQDRRPKMDRPNTQEYVLDNNERILTYTNRVEIDPLKDEDLTWFRHTGLYGHFFDLGGRSESENVALAMRHFIKQINEGWYDISNPYRWSIQVKATDDSMFVIHLESIHKKERYIIDGNKGFNLISSEEIYQDDKSLNEDYLRCEYIQLPNGRYILKSGQITGVHNDVTFEYRLETKEIQTDFEAPDEWFEEESLNIPDGVSRVDYSFSPPLKYRKGDKPDKEQPK